MKVTEKERKKYIQEIKRNLVCNNEQRKKFLASFSDNMDEYLNDNPDADFAQLQKDLGTPEEIANAFLENASASNVKKRMSFVKWIIASVVVIVLSVIVTLVIEIINAHIQNGGYGTETITIEEIITDNPEEEYITEETE